MLACQGQWTWPVVGGSVSTSGSRVGAELISESLLASRHIDRGETSDLLAGAIDSAHSRTASTQRFRGRGGGGLRPKF